MGAVSVQGAEAPLRVPYSNVPPIGLETASVESLCGYVDRLAAAYAVPASVLAKRAIDSVVPSRIHTVVNNTVGRLNGSGEVVGHLSQGIGSLTGPSELHRLSFLAPGQRLGVSARGLVAATRRWCPACWHGDAEHPYERKVWWLGVVDVCPEHRCFLDTPCGTCGRAPAGPDPGRAAVGLLVLRTSARRRRRSGSGRWRAGRRAVPLLRPSVVTRCPKISKPQ